jgi:UDP-N-acetylglucosamine 1-carboxyvinyltransferase
MIGGNKRLIGEIELSSSKNAILPILAASLLTDEQVKINRVPNIKDVAIMVKLLKELGLNIKHKQNSLIIHGEPNISIPSCELVRSSYSICHYPL